MRSRGVDFLGSGDSPPGDSWYVKVEPDTPQFVEIESDDVGVALREMWTAQGLHELAAISDSIAALSATIGTDDAARSEVSSAAYAMY
jgi:hypothetical protein